MQKVWGLSQSCSCFHLASVLRLLKSHLLCLIIRRTGKSEKSKKFHHRLEMSEIGNWQGAMILIHRTFKLNQQLLKVYSYISLLFHLWQLLKLPIVFFMVIIVTLSDFICFVFVWFLFQKSSILLKVLEQQFFRPCKWILTEENVQVFVFCFHLWELETHCIIK